MSRRKPSKTRSAACARTRPRRWMVVTWEDYATDLTSNLEGLCRRVHTGAYRAQPSRRKYIPKPDGRQRPLGIAALEDKIVQQAVVDLLTPIYEEEFLGFSYGF